MGAWGAGIFSNDTAADIRGDFREALEDGLSPEQATEKLIKSAGETADDQDDATFFWTGLAAAQMALGVLQPRVRDRAISLIEAGGDVAQFVDAKTAAKRKLVLEKLRGQLLGTQKAPVRVRRPRRVPSPVSVGDVFLLALDDGRQARFRVLAMNEHRDGQFPIVEMIDDRGRPYRRYYKNPELMLRGDKFARYHVVSRMKGLPKPRELTIVGKAQPEPAANPPNYLIWQNLKIEAKRLLDEPKAKPE